MYVAEKEGAVVAIETVDRVPSQATVRPLTAGAWTLVTGAIGMVVGAVLLFASGTEADAALMSGDIGGYLTDVEGARGMVIANLSTWILAICVLCAGGALLATCSPRGAARSVSTFAFTTGAGTAVMFFSLWLGIVIGLAPAHVAGAEVESVALALLHAAVNADWVITVMILTVGGGFLVLSARATWAPRWLVRWAYVSFAVGTFALVALVLGWRSLLFIEVPLGIGLVLAAGLSARRS